MIEKPLVNKEFVLEKFPGKGGWTYVLIPQIKQEKNNKFGWVQVKGNIEGYALKQYKLMPYKGGLFLPVKAEIRKKTGKKEGDKVKVVLYHDDSKFEVPDELMLCLLEEPAALRTFEKLSDSEKRLYVVWIYSAKRETTKTNRIVKSLERLSQGLKLYEKSDMI